jgi:hypothetical protein
MCNFVSRPTVGIYVQSVGERPRRPKRQHSLASTQEVTTSVVGRGIEYQKFFLHYIQKSTKYYHNWTLSDFSVP